MGSDYPAHQVQGLVAILLGNAMGKSKKLNNMGDNKMIVIEERKNLEK